MHQSDPDFCVLHAIRLRGMAPKEALETMTADIEGLDASERLPGLAEQGLIKELPKGRGYMLAKEGRQRHADLLEADRSAGNLKETLRPAYERFLTVNQPFIDLCSAWQVRTDTDEPNDHTDEDYDAGVLGGLEEYHEVATEVAQQVGEVAERFAPYGPRFEKAIDHIRAGEREWFTKPQIDSYHTIWFELHEDLLLSQDIERTEGA